MRAKREVLMHTFTLMRAVVGVCIFVVEASIALALGVFCHAALTVWP